MTSARLVWHQYRYDQRTFWRDPAAVFFTIALPLIFLFIFVSIFGNEDIEVGGREISGSTYYVPGILALAIVSATTVNLAITMTTLRERGTLKRVRSTPLPPWVFMAGRLLTALVVSVLMVVIVTLLGRLVYGVDVPTGTLPGLALAVIIGTAACCCLGFALTAVIPSENAAPAVSNALVLPLYFFSGIFIPNSDIPEGMQVVGDIFPVKHLFEALLTAFDPVTRGSGIEGIHLVVMAAWGVAGLVVATRTFRWSPRSS
ncbi:MAG: ABC transporter permease [Actinomycetota bacterium]|nr:ABC transporter permease [Actinomycetota bacterium]